MQHCFLKSESTAGYRRVPFVAVDITALQTRVSQAEILGTFTIKIWKNGAGSAVTPSGTTITEVDTTNAKGSMYLQLNAADLDTVGPLIVRISSSGGTKVMEPREILCDVMEVSQYAVVRGMTGTALPNAAAGAAGSVLTFGSGAFQVNQNANGQIDARVVAGDFLTDIDRLLGLLHENSMIDNVSYGDQSIITSARIRHFASAAALAAATPGNANGTDSETRRWLITCDDAGGGEYNSYKIARQL